MARYQQLRRSEVGPRLLLAALLQRGLRHRWLVEAVFGLMVRRPRLCDLVVNLTGDCLHPRDLLRPSFWRHWHRLGAGA